MALESSLHFCIFSGLSQRALQASAVEQPKSSLALLKSSGLEGPAGFLPASLNLLANSPHFSQFWTWPQTSLQLASLLQPKEPWVARKISEGFGTGDFCNPR